MLAEDTNNRELSIRINRYNQELGDRLFITQLLSSPSTKELQATTTASQHLVKEACYSTEVQATHSPLPNYAQGFKAVFVKTNFDTLPEYRYQDHTIELLLGSEPKSSKVYPLSLVEQRKFDTFLEENLQTRYIRPFKFSIVALVFFIKKKNGFFHLVQDY